MVESSVNVARKLYFTNFEPMRTLDRTITASFLRVTLTDPSQHSRIPIFILRTISLYRTFYDFLQLLGSAFSLLYRTPVISCLIHIIHLTDVSAVSLPVSSAHPSSRPPSSSRAASWLYFLS